MSGVATAIGGSAVVGFLGAQSAAHTQANAAQDATNAQLAMWNEQNANQKPYRDAGYKALDTIGQNMDAWNKPFTIDDFKANMDPAYQFNLDQGQKAIQQSSAAKAGLVNAGTLGSLSNYSQSMASNEYSKAFDRYQQQINNSYNRLASVAGLGQTATQNTNAAGMNAANNIGQNIIGAGNANAAGIVGGANAFNSAVGQGVSYLNTQDLLKRLGPKTDGPVSIPEMPANTFSMPELGSQYSDAKVFGLEN